jgi:hypothetical protein
MEESNRPTAPNANPNVVSRAREHLEDVDAWLEDERTRTVPSTMRSIRLTALGHREVLLGKLRRIAGLQP